MCYTRRAMQIDIQCRDTCNGSKVVHAWAPLEKLMDCWGSLHL